VKLAFRKKIATAVATISLMLTAVSYGFAGGGGGSMCNCGIGPDPSYYYCYYFASVGCAGDSYCWACFVGIPTDCDFIQCVCPPLPTWPIWCAGLEQ